jgi:threonine synthase
VPKFLPYIIQSMLFRSTAGKAQPVSFREAMMRGLAPDGGLYLPETIPTLPGTVLNSLRNLTFQELSFEIASLWLQDEVPTPILHKIIDTSMSFKVPLVPVKDNVYALELFHGPTLAFKDFGARFMAQMMSHFIRDLERELTVLVATSGDTGSAVANGFHKVNGIRVILLYPKGKISEIQRKQMTTLGENVTALAVEGTFDDCQRLVKQAFSDVSIGRHLDLTSANSINIARLLPQSFYYFLAIAQLSESEAPVVSVPSGNFGNLTAGLFAKRMGLFVYQFIAATNSNDVVPEYLNTGVFKPRSSVQTVSNAMDVGNPSNFERMLALYENKNAMQKEILGESFSDDETRDSIAELYADTKYVMDPHGAVAYLGLQQFRKMVPASKRRPGIFLETAHPAKFPEAVEAVIGKAVEMPPTLASCLQLPEHSIPIGPSFQEFKSFLMDIN